jgi:hypothetical protein
MTSSKMVSTDASECPVITDQSRTVVSPSLQVNGRFGAGSETKLPVGIVSSQAVVRGPAATIRRGRNILLSSTASWNDL